MKDRSTTLNLAPETKKLVKTKAAELGTTMERVAADAFAKYFGTAEIQLRSEAVERGRWAKQHGQVEAIMNSKYAIVRNALIANLDVFELMVTGGGLAEDRGGTAGLRETEGRTEGSDGGTEQTAEARDKRDASLRRVERVVEEIGGSGKPGAGADARIDETEGRHAGIPDSGVPPSHAAGPGGKEETKKPRKRGT